MKIFAKILIVLVIIAAVCGAFYFINTDNGGNEVEQGEEPASNNEVENNNEVSLIANLATAEDLTNFIEEIYKDNENLYPSLASNTIDLTDPDLVARMTGLENGEDLESLVVSEPMMSSQPYSLVIAKVKDGVDVEAVAKKMNEGVDPVKWICVSAEKVYTTSSDDIVFLVMGFDDIATPVYTKFKTLAGKIGQEYERVVEEGEIPEEML